MPSFSHIGALLTAAALLSAPVFAQNPAQNDAQKPAPSNAHVQHVIVRGTGDEMEVEIQTSGTPVAPDTQAITGPDRIVVDFPGALPAAELRALKVNRGPLKGVRSGLFFSNPPITRIVLDLVEPHTYKIAANGNTVVVKLGQVSVAGAPPQEAPAPHAAKLQNVALSTATLAPSANAVVTQVSNAVVNTAQPLSPVAEAPPPSPASPVTVTFSNGLLRIQAEKATLSQVLFEVQRQTQAEIAIPAGAEQEVVVADLGPASAREVLASLLNGSPYNFIFVGNELNLERVILTRRDPNIF
jgi:hypothetical protein